MKNKFPQAALAAIAFTVLLPLSSHGQILVADTFSLNGNDRTAGATLAGTSPEVGSGTYQGVNGNAAVFGTAGGLVYPTDGMGNAGADVSAYIPFTPPANEELSFSMTFTYGGVIDGGSYPANYNRLFIAFNGGGSPYGQGVFLDDLGNVDLFDTGINLIGTTTVPFSASATYTLTLNYDPTANTASVDVNGLQVIAPTSLGANTYGTAIYGADFFTYQPSATPDLSVSDLSVVATATPEPSTTALLLGGLACVGLVARKRLTNLTV
jgi:hypothetical protein